MCRILLKITILSICCILTSCLGGVFYIDLGKDYAWVECNRTIIKITKVSHLPFYRLSRIIKHCNILIDNLLTSRK